jgi:methylthioribose-1-phosphate isomerase
VVYGMGLESLPRTVAWLDGEVQLIDQTRLPFEFKLVKVKTVEGVAEAIKSMVVRGAPAIGVAAAMGLALTAYHSKAENRERLMDELKKAVNLLKASRPTARNLFWALDRVIGVAEQIEGETRDVIEAVVQEAFKIAEEDVQVNRRLGLNGATLLRDGDTVLTYCK